MRQQIGALILGAVVILTSACGTSTVSSGQGPAVAVPAPASTTGTQQVTMTVGNSTQFAPTSLEVRAGQPVELSLHNGGSTPHDFTLVDGPSRPVKIEVQGGQTARGTFTIDTPGTYSFICSVPGHAAAGMRGTITVKSS